MLFVEAETYPTIMGPEKEWFWNIQHNDIQQKMTILKYDSNILEAEPWNIGLMSGKDQTSI